MKKSLIVILLVVLMGMLVSSCSPEDEYLRQVFPKESRKYAIQQLIKIKDQIEDKEKVSEKLLKLDKTPDIGTAVMAVGEIGYADSIPRIAEIADECMKNPSVRNLKTLESIGQALGMFKDPRGVPILEKYFTLKTPEHFASGQRSKPESVAKAAAIMALGSMPKEGKKLVSNIVTIMETEKEDFTAQYNAATVLGNFGDAKAVKPLVSALFYEKMGNSLFTPARAALIKLGKDAEKELIKAYGGKIAKVNAIQDANKYRATHKMCPMYLKKEKNSKDVDPALVKKGGCANEAQWQATLSSIDTTTKLKSSIILADIRSKKAVDMLITELEGQLAIEAKQPFLTEHLSVQLAKMGDLKATNTLLKMVSSDFALKEMKYDKKGGKAARLQARLAKRGQEISIRMKGAEALAILGDKKALPFLMKAIKGKDISEENVDGSKIIFYEPKMWAADAFTRISGNAEDADQFIAIAKTAIAKGKELVGKIEARTKKNLEKQSKAKPLTKEEMEKKINNMSRLVPNYESTKRYVKMMERFAKRMKTAKQCRGDIACFAKKLDDKDPAVVEKALYMIAFSGKMSAHKDKVTKLFYHSEPFVRNALAIALLKTEDKAYVSEIKKALEKEGDKVEYAASSKEFKAILSYLQSF